MMMMVIMMITEAMLITNDDESLMMVTIVSDGERKRGCDGTGPRNDKTSLLHRQAARYGGFLMIVMITEKMMITEVVMALI